MEDKRRPELVVPYVHKPDAKNEMPGSTLFNTLPMVAMMMRSKMLAWAALLLSVQAYLSQPIRSSSDEENSGLNMSTILTSLMGVAVSYMEFVVAPTKPKQA